MAEVEILSTGADTPADDDVLELGEAPETAVAAEGDGTVEPIEENDFPDTFDEDGEVEKPHLVAQLRQADKLKTQRIRELEHRLAAPVITRTKKPDLYDDCEGDPDRYETALFAWRDNEAKADEAERAPVAQANQQAQEFEQTRLTYKANAEKLGKPDFADAEAKVIDGLDMAQQSTILMAAKAPAKFIYALGRSPNRLAQLSLITNPIKLAAEVARIEGARTMPRKDPPNIDTPIRGSARLSTQSGDAKADQLIDKAAKNGGDVTALLDHNRAKRAKAA